MAVSTPLRFKTGAQQQANMGLATKEHKRMWLVVCVFIFFVAVGLIGNVPESLDRVYHLHRPALGNQAPVEQHAEVIKASKLDVEAARAQSAEVKPGEVEPSDAPVNKDASKATSKVALCTSIKWEQPADMEEWVQYYQWLGVDTIGLIDNNSNVTASIAERLAPYVDSGLVQLEAWGNDTPAQREAFNRCFQKFKHTHDWVAFFDADEYLMLLESGITLHELLEEYKEYPALAVNWIMFGSSGRVARPVEGGMLRWYQQCRTLPEPHIKVIANAKHVRTVISPHPHNIYYNNDANAVVENFDKVEHVYGEDCEQNPACKKDCKKDCKPMPGYSYPTQELKRIALFHYVTRYLLQQFSVTARSWEDFERKSKRGSASVLGVRKGLPFFDCTQRETNSTGGICDEGVKAWSKCCSPESLANRSIQTFR